MYVCMYMDMYVSMHVCMYMDMYVSTLCPVFDHTYIYLHNTAHTYLYIDVLTICVLNVECVD